MAWAGGWREHAPEFWPGCPHIQLPLCGALCLPAIPELRVGKEQVWGERRLELWSPRLLLSLWLLAGWESRAQRGVRNTLGRVVGRA